MINPFLLPKRHKSLAIATIDNIVLQKTTESLKGETREEVKADLSFRYEDEILTENTGRNFAKLFLELVGRLKRWEKVTLEEYNAILEVKFAADIYKNRDYYSFMTHLAGKEHYSIKDIRENAETFLEGMVAEYISPDQLDEFADMAFEIHFGTDTIKLELEDSGEIGEITDMTFVRIDERRMD